MIQVIRPVDVRARLRTALGRSTARIRPEVPPEIMERWHRRLAENADLARRAGVAISTLTVGIGASMAWILASSSEPSHTLGLGLFLAGHIGLIAVLTLTSFTFTFIDRRRNLFLAPGTAQ